MLFKKLYKALETSSRILDDCEGNGLRYDINTKSGYVNIQINMEEYSSRIIKFDIFKVLGEPLTPSNENQSLIQEFGAYVSELDMETGVLSTITLYKDGQIHKTVDSDLVKDVLDELETRLDKDLE